MDALDHNQESWPRADEWLQKWKELNPQKQTAEHGPH